MLAVPMAASGRLRHVRPYYTPSFDAVLRAYQPSLTSPWICSPTVPGARPRLAAMARTWGSHGVPGLSLS